MFPLWVGAHQALARLHAGLGVGALGHGAQVRALVLPENTTAGCEWEVCWEVSIR